MLHLLRKPSTFARRPWATSCSLATVATRLTFATLFILGLALRTAQADFFLHEWQDHHEYEGSFQLGADIFYYGSGANYGNDNAVRIPPGFYSYNRIENDYDATCGITRELSVYGRLDWLRAQVDSLNLSGSAYGLGDLTLGANYRIYRSPLGMARVDLQIQLDFPAYGNSSSLDRGTPYLGDGSVDASFGLLFTLPLAIVAGRHEISIDGGAAFTHRSGDFSEAVPYALYLNANLRPAMDGGLVRARLGFYGFQSLRTDTSLAAGTAAPGLPSPGTGGNLITDAINPSLLAMRVQGAYTTPNDLGFSVFTSRSLEGQNAPLGITIGIGFETHFGGPGSRTEPAKNLTDAPHPTYGLAARITSVHERMNLVRIDQGTRSQVEVGDIFDLFPAGVDPAAGAPTARAIVTHVHADEAALRIQEYFQPTWVEAGFQARRLGQ